MVHFQIINFFEQPPHTHFTDSGRIGVSKERGYW